MEENIRKETARRDDEALVFLLNDHRGRWFFQRLLQNCRVLESSFAGECETFYNEGRRAVGLDYLRQVSNLDMRCFRLKQQAELEYFDMLLCLEKKQREEDEL